MLSRKESLWLFLLLMYGTFQVYGVIIYTFCLIYENLPFNISFYNFLLNCLQ